jgi:hypothetical protein
MATKLEFNRGGFSPAAKGLTESQLPNVGDDEARSKAVEGKITSLHLQKGEVSQFLGRLQGKIQSRSGYLKLMHTEHDRTMAFETKSGLGALFTKNKRQLETKYALKGLFSKLNLNSEQIKTLDEMLRLTDKTPLKAKEAAGIINLAITFSGSNPVQSTLNNSAPPSIQLSTIQAGQPKNEFERRLATNLDAFRTISVDGIEIGGSARPAGTDYLKPGTSVSDVLSDIKSAGFTHILSLDQSERPEYTELKEGITSAGLKHLDPDELDIADAGFATGNETKLYEKSKPLDVNALKKFKLQVDDIKEKDGKILVHCGAGAGRTGTMLASLLLADLVKNNPGYKRSARKNQHLDLYGDVTTQTTPLVAKAIETLRQADKNFTEQEKSVETEREVRLLEDYEKELFANP